MELRMRGEVLEVVKRGEKSRRVKRSGNVI